MYLPGTLATIETLRTRRELPPGPAYAVTPALRAELGDAADLEELEYEAFTQAAAASLELLRVADPALARRRVVVSADVPVRLVRPDPDPAGGTARVAVAGPVPLAAVAAIHLDSDAAEPEVTATLAGETDEVEYELEWYDVSELERLPERPGG